VDLASKKCELGKIAKSEKSTPQNNPLYPIVEMLLNNTIKCKELERALESGIICNQV
jgi:hypothetical protein